ncbi:MAG: DUF1700 domain-containing protein [Eubacteriales bacterium]|nr:DUF1700 domain-containing protein [Eubacteriales bacterium]
MNREEFLEGLETALSGNVPPAVVQENLRYYREYIRTEMQKGRSQEDVMEELGDPRLIARTIMDTTPGAGETSYEEYQEGGRYGGGYESGGQEGYGQRRENVRSSIHFYDLNKWYWKLLGILLVVGIISVVITVVTGLLSLVIPLLPVIGLVAVIMWFVQGPRR